MGMTTASATPVVVMRRCRVMVFEKPEVVDKTGWCTQRDTTSHDRDFVRRWEWGTIVWWGPKSFLHNPNFLHGSWKWIEECTRRTSVMEILEISQVITTQLKIIVVSRLNWGRSRQLWVRQSSRCCRVSGQIILPRSPDTVRALERITIKKSRLFYSSECFHGRR